MGANRVKILLTIVDLFLVKVIITPLVIIYWRGAWDIWDHYCKVGDSDIPGNWISAGVGTVVCLLMNYTTPWTSKYLSKKVLNYWIYHILVRLYLLIYCFAHLGQWRGIWEVTDLYSNKKWRENLIGLGVSSVLAFSLRIFKLGVAVPWGITMDTEDEHNVVTPRFRSSPDNKFVYFLDHVFSQCVCLPTAIFIWRCIWNVMDDLIYPDNKDLSNGLTFGVGFAGLVILHIIKYPVSKLSATLDDKPLVYKLIVENVFYVAVIIMVLLEWRGLWNLIEKYFIPDEMLGGWVCHWIGFVGLLVLLGVCSAADFSIPVDGEETGGAGVLPYMDYMGYCLRDLVPQAKESTEIQAVKLEP